MSTASDAAEEWSNRPAARVLHYAIVYLMIAAALLAGTVFDLAQIGCEIATIILLSYGILKVRRTATDAVLFAALAGTSLASFLVNEFVVFALNFKLFLLCILTLTYFRKVRFLPRRLIKVLFVVNALLLVHQFVTGHFIFPSASFFGFYKGYVNDRPIGLFLTPHASSFFIGVCLLYTIFRKPAKTVVSIALMAMTSSLTSLVAVVAQAADYVFRKWRAYRLSFGRIPLITFIVAPLVVLFFLIDPFLELLRVSSYTRYYSVDIILPQLFDVTFFKEALRFLPRDYVSLTIQQEATYAQFGNEIGLIKVFVEGGLVLGALTLWALLRELKAYRVMIWISLLHYSFVIITPFFLFLMLQYNREMTQPQEAREGSPDAPPPHPVPSGTQLVPTMS